MSENQHGLFEKVWASLVGMTAVTGIAVCGVPTRIGAVPTTDAAPSGLRLLTVTGTPAEAAMLRQILAAEGYHPEYVSSMNTGRFGTTGNNEVHIPEAEHEAAGQFLSEYYGAAQSATA